MTCALLAAYALIAILTFGRITSHPELFGNGLYQIEVAGFGAILWPLYWSWEIQMHLHK